MKKLKLLTLIPCMCLSACSKNTIYGEYEFRLGKTDGSHLGLSVELTDEANDKHEDMSNLVLRADLGSDFSIEKMVEEYSEEYPFIKELLEPFINVLPEERAIKGYYHVTDIQNEKYGYRVKIGSDDLTELFKKVFPEIPDIGEDISVLTTPEMIEMIACAYIGKNQFTIQIPVSTEDVQQQLAWYGYLIDFEGASLLTRLDENKLPGPKGEERFGVHPAVIKDEKGSVVSREADIMNEKFEFEFSHTYLYQENPEDPLVRVPVGSFVTRLREDTNQKYLLFQPFDEKMSLLNIEGYFSAYDSNVVKFSVANPSQIVAVTHNNKSGNEEGFIDADGNEFLYKDILKKPFEFRDFHDVKIGLTKI